MKNFNVLSTKRNLLKLFMSEKINIVCSVILFAAIINVLFGAISLLNLGCSVGNSLAYLILAFFLYIEIEDDDGMLLAMPLFAIFLIICNIVNFHIKELLVIGFLPNFIFGFFSTFIIFAVFFIVLILTIISIFLIVYLFLYVPYNIFMKYWIRAKLPTTKEELVACGVKNRIDCILYYLFMQKGFKKGTLWPDIPLYLHKEEYPKLIDLFYSFPVEVKEFEKMSSFLYDKYYLTIDNQLMEDLFPEYSPKSFYLCREHCLGRLLGMSSHYDKANVRNLLLDLKKNIELN